MPYVESSAEEKKLGLELFFTNTPGLKGRLKKLPEDFIVSERSIKVEPLTEAELKARDPTLPIYTYAKVKSKNWETNRLVQKLASELNISTDNVFFAGSKDKRAITTQLMAFRAGIEKVRAISLRDVETSDYFISSRLLTIGDLLGNDFEIILSNPEAPTEQAKEIIDTTNEQVKQLNGYPNFFGVQRFGIIRPVTHKIGKCLVQKKFEEAVLMYIGHPIKGEPPEDYNARAEFDRCWDLEWAINNYPEHLVFERLLIKYLLNHSDDYPGSLKQFPKNLSTMFIHSYQSFLFNKMLCERIRADLPFFEPVIGDIVLPINSDGLPVHKTWITVTDRNYDKIRKKCIQGKAFVSGVLFGSETGFAGGEFGEIERKIIQNESLEQTDFVIPELSLISSKGSRREVLAPVSNFKYEILEDNIKFNFGLIKGAYATTLLREYMKSGIRNY